MAGAYTDMEEAGMIPDIDIPEEADYAEIDKMQFSRAFTNLLTNAIKHNEAGTSIKISMKNSLVTGDQSHGLRREDSIRS